ncbi:TetR/AcrR family transcriptional regulator [Micromonospora zhanjiangensis]
MAGPPISRGAGARQRVLRAALEVLDADGLAGFTMEAVARRAGASKATIYRHWSGTGPLLIDAMDATFRPFPTPDTGRLATDVAQILGAFVTLLENAPFPRLLAAFIDAAERDPTLAALHADLTRRRREPLLVVLARARDRGELPGRRSGTAHRPTHQPVLLPPLHRAPARPADPGRRRHRPGPASGQ